MVFPADEDMPLSIADVDAFISIVDDDIDEADDQFFMAYLERVNATNPELAILERVVSTCIIVDNDRKCQWHSLIVRGAFEISVWF